MNFSIIIPVYNRPQELEELLTSLSLTTFQKPFEVVIVEDGSSVKADEIIEKFRTHLNLKYFYKSNTGPGDSRNFGMDQATGDYFLLFDSDCIIPAEYLNQVHQFLEKNPVDFFGGADTADGSFSDFQKAVNFSMTSFITTGGIRGKDLKDFQPRSFNMGLSKEAFKKSGGFGEIHPGEDPDLTLRLWQMGFKSSFIPTAVVIHKRRISWEAFFNQTNKFGKARPILDLWHPHYKKITFWLPSLFIIGLDITIILVFFGYYLLVYLFLFYFILVIACSLIQTKNLKIAFMSLATTLIQFYGYGLGFLKSWFFVHVLKKRPQNAFPELFFIKK